MKRALRLNVAILTVFFYFTLSSCFARDTAMVIEVNGSVKAEIKGGSTWDLMAGETLDEGLTIHVLPNSSLTLLHMSLNKEFTLPQNTRTDLLKSGFSSAIGQLVEKNIDFLPHDLNLDARSSNQVAAIKLGKISIDKKPGGQAQVQGKILGDIKIEARTPGMTSGNGGPETKDGWGSGAGIEASSDQPQQPPLPPPPPLPPSPSSTEPGDNMVAPAAGDPGSADSTETDSGGSGSKSNSTKVPALKGSTEEKRKEFTLVDHDFNHPQIAFPHSVLGSGSAEIERFCVKVGTNWYVLHPSPSPVIGWVCINLSEEIQDDLKQTPNLELFREKQGKPFLKITFSQIPIESFLNIRGALILESKDSLGQAAASWLSMIKNNSVSLDIAGHHLDRLKAKIKKSEI